MLSLVITVVLFIIIYYIKLKRNRPPGPFSFPFIGNLYLIDPVKPYITLTELSEKYGPIYGLQMGSIYTVVLTDEALIREAFKSEEFNGRAPLYVTHGIMGGYGLICAEGELWKDQRKLSIKMLKEMGMVKFGEKRSDFEFRILKWVQECIKTLIIKSELNHEIDPLDTLHNTLGNVMNDIVFGVTYDHDDDTWLYLRLLQEEGVKHIGVSSAVNFMPWLRFLPHQRKILDFLLTGKDKTHDIYDEIINRTEKHSHEEVPSITSLYLEEKDRRIQDNDDSIKHCTDTQLKHLLADLFGAGVDTTLTTIRWFLMFVANKDKVQNKIRSEFKEHLTTMPTLDDYDKLPYLRACIAETQRIRSVVPIGIPHGTSKDSKLDRYFIPKNTMIIPLQWAVHMDPNIWPEPYKFDPNRFLDGDGKFSAPSSFIPFQTGKRMCLGEELAKMLLFLFCSNILYNFKLRFVDEVEDILGDCGITLTPPRHKILFEKIG